MKWCNKCQTEKPEIAFSKNKRTKDGLDTQCKECVSRRGSDHYKRNKEKYAERGRNWRHSNPEKAAAYCKKWRDANPGAQSKCDASWYSRNSHIKLAADKARREANISEFLERERASYARRKESIKIKNIRWRTANPDKICAYASRRRAAISKRIPSWLTNEHLKQIEFFYTQAAMLKELSGEEWHVDHIVPLRGKTVSGLHVPWNLQLLPATENLKKTNHHEP